MNNAVNLLSNHWKGRKDFLLAQGQIAVVLVVAYVGNNWPHSYPRNENAKPYMFWAMNALLLIAGIATLKHDGNSSSRGVQLLSRPQTEEWKGWMQWAFIMVRFGNSPRKSSRTGMLSRCYTNLLTPLCLFHHSSTTIIDTMVPTMRFESLFRYVFEKLVNT